MSNFTKKVQQGNTFDIFVFLGRPTFQRNNIYVVDSIGHRLFYENNVSHKYLDTHLLAHLSQRLIGELIIVYPCSGVRRCRRRCRPPFSNVFSETA